MKHIKQMTDEITRFLNGGYKNIKKDLQEKMSKSGRDHLSLNVRRNIVTKSAILKRQWKNKTMMSSDFTERDVFGYAMDKGWMCVQVFFIRQGKLIERDVSLFPIYGEP